MSGPDQPAFLSHFRNGKSALLTDVVIKAQQSTGEFCPRVSLDNFLHANTKVELTLVILHDHPDPRSHALVDQLCHNR